MRGERFAICSKSSVRCVNRDRAGGTVWESPAASSWLKSSDAGVLFGFTFQGGILFFETLVLVLETLEEEDWSSTLCQ